MWIFCAILACNKKWSNFKELKCRHFFVQNMFLYIRKCLLMISNVGLWVSWSMHALFFQLLFPYILWPNDKEYKFFEGCWKEFFLNSQRVNRGWQFVYRVSFLRRLEWLARTCLKWRINSTKSKSLYVCYTRAFLFIDVLLQ